MPGGLAHWREVMGKLSLSGYIKSLLVAKFWMRQRSTAAALASASDIYWCGCVVARCLYRTFFRRVQQISNRDIQSLWHAGLFAVLTRQGSYSSFGF